MEDERGSLDLTRQIDELKAKLKNMEWLKNHDYKWLVKGSLDRLIFQASGFLLIFVASSINLVFKRFNN